MAVAGRMAALIVLAVGLSVLESAAQNTPAPGRERRFSIEGSAGFHIDYTGTAQAIGVGFSPTRNLTLLFSAEQSHVDDEIDFFDDGFAAERGGTDRFASVVVRYTFLVDKRVSPFVIGGAGRGTSRTNVSDLFPEPRTRNVQLIFYGGGVRIPLRPRLDLIVDGRFTMAMEGRTDYFAVRLPIRAGLAWYF